MPERSSTPRLISLRMMIVAAALAGIAAYVYPVQRIRPSRKHHARQVATETAKFVPAPNGESSPFGHAYYRYSVIPGGAHSPEELRDALARDTVARAHYADFDASKARLVRLSSDRTWYVSFRQGDKVYWTRKAIALHAGEMLLTDGVHYARTRCGNRLQQSAAQPVAPIDPDPKAFQTPAVVQTSWNPHLAELDAAPDLRVEIATNRITGLPPGLTPLIDPIVPSYNNGLSPETRDYVPTEHEKPLMFADDGPNPMTMSPIFYASETPLPSSVPEPGTAALGSLALIGVSIATRWTRARRREKQA